MAKIINPELGEFSGKIGNIVGCKGSKRDFYMRKAPKKTVVPPTVMQLGARQRFSMVCSFLKPISKILNALPLPAAEPRTVLALALSRIMKDSVTGPLTNPELVYPSMVLYKGNLKPVTGARFSRDTEGDRWLYWNTELYGNQSPHDTGFALLYGETSSAWSYHPELGKRFSGEVKLDNPFFDNEKVHAWLGFRSVNGQQVSDSVYAGSLLY